MSNYLDLMAEAWPALLEGLKITVILTILSLALGLIVGLVMALMRLSRRYLLRAIAHVYIDVVRGTPVLVQLFLIYYGLPQFGIRVTPILAAVLALGANYGAYLAEVFRAARYRQLCELDGERHVSCVGGHRHGVTSIRTDHRLGDVPKLRDLPDRWCDVPRDQFAARLVHPAP